MSNKQLIEALDDGARAIEAWHESRSLIVPEYAQRQANLLRDQAEALSAHCPITVERLDELIEDYRIYTTEQDNEDQEGNEIFACLTHFRRLIAGAE